MSRWKTALCLLLLAALAPLLPRLRGALPTNRQALIEAKYGGWSGVLRLWVCEGWQPGSGSFAGWLNRCVAAFEKRHPGVYVQAESVGAATLSGWDEGGLSPDLLLFPPGVLASPRNLAPLDAPESLRAGLRRAGDWRGACCALPVAMGGYAVLRSSAEGDCVALEDDAFHRRHTALRYLPAQAEAPESSARPVLPELDLGLPASAQSAGADWTVSADAWKDFANGDAAGLLVTPRELRRLEALSAQGRGPDWRLASTSRFTDLLLFAAVSAQGDAERQALGAAFAASLLEDACQGELYRAGAFAVTGATSGYAAGDSLGAMEAMLREAEPVAARAFGME